MQIPVLIEPVAGNGYRAAAFSYSVEGASKEEAIEKMKKLLKDRSAEGAEIVMLPTSPQPPPWAEFAGDLKDDPMLEAWKKAMADYRRKREKQLDKVLRRASKRKAL